MGSQLSLGGSKMAKEEIEEKGEEGRAGGFGSKRNAEGSRRRGALVGAREMSGGDAKARTEDER